MKYEVLAKDILAKVGGRENILTVKHCVTRLRFQLKDESKADTEGLNQMDGVMKVIQSGGQYQVVIGVHVTEVYEDFLQVAGMDGETEATVTAQSASEEKKGLFSEFLTLIMNIFSPVLGVLAASGMIKGMNSLFLLMNVLTDKDGTYIILNAIGDSLFYFLPIVLGYTTAKRFHVKEIIGITLGGVLVYPTIVQLMTAQPLEKVFQGTWMESDVYLTFLNMPVILQNYTSTVIPIILAVYTAAQIEKVLNRIVPSVVKGFFVPFFTLLITAPLAFLVIGPIALTLQKLLGALVNGLILLSPGVAGFVIGAFWSIFVMFGLHWGVIPLIVTNLSTFGYDVINPLIFTGAFASCGAVLGVILRTRSNKVRNIAVPALISSFFGINEPSMYGVLIPRKKIFIATLLSAGIGAAVVGFTGAKLYVFSASGIFGLPGFVPPTGIDGSFIGLLVGTAISIVLALVAALILEGKEVEKELKEESGANV